MPGGAIFGCTTILEERSVAGLESLTRQRLDPRMTLSRVFPKRRLLFLLPFAPRLDATHGGGRATAELLVQLATRHRVALICLRAASEPPVDDLLRERCEIVEEVPRLDHGLSLWQRSSRILSLLRGRPLWVAVTAVAVYRARLRKFVQTWQPDIVQIECHVMGQYIPALEGCPAPRVLTEHEPGAKAARDLWESSAGLAKAGYRLAALAWERFERSVIRQVQAVVVFTESDRRSIAPLASEKIPIICIPLGTVIPERPLNPTGGQPKTLLFVGNFVHPPNADAALRLIMNIFPRVRLHFPDLVLHIVGDQPTRQMRRVTDDKIIVTGRVPDVTPYLDAAAVVVVPLRLGGGMRVKVLEALAAGKAVIASPLAVEGLNVIDGENVLLAETDQQFCKAIIRLLADPEKRTSLAKRARSWACANLGWENSVAAYEQVYNMLVQRSCAPTQAQ
jgi:glycosyltransferase involved in cell wall biosynthesis